MKNQYSIALILPYFGKLPNYFDFWISSCSYNKDIDFLIFTDQSIESKYNNIKIIEITFKDFRNIFLDYFDYNIALNTSYKLCDFKVVYGLVLDSFVSKYDFWGFCDCDLIFGNIRSFITDDILEKYDHIFDMGQFQLQRTNDPKYLEALDKMEIKNGFKLKDIFCDPKNHVADEYPYGMPFTYAKLYPDRIFSQFTPNGRFCDNPSPFYKHFADIYNTFEYYYKNMYFEYSATVPIWNRNFTDEQKNRKYMLYSFERGNLKRIFVQNHKIKNEEIMYVHFRLRKFKIKTTSLHSFLIIPNRFLSNKQLSWLSIFYYGHKRYLLEYFHLGMKKIVYFRDILRRK